MAGRDEEINWDELVLVGSLLGNILQLSQKAEREKQLNLTIQEIGKLTRERDRINQGLRQLQAAYQSLKKDAESMRTQNEELLKQLQARDQEISNLKARLTEALKTDAPGGESS